VPLFRKVLIANRGEIAVRVARTCRVMGIPTVAVYSDADANALHTRYGDELVPIGPAEAASSYLNVEALVAAARRTGAEAVHPGYGFLSQNADFAEAVAAAGIVFVGPPGEVHRRMGDKKGARRLMAAAGVPVVPGYEGDDQQDETLLREARRIGWPVMIKPSRGGGGKGMRVVHAEAAFAAALASCRREARSAFGDDVMVIERFLTRARHVEVQVVADGHGHVLHLGERECSVQRRHQKVVEETPSAALTGQGRAALCAAGTQAARAAGYLGAGTVEFLLDDAGAFYFLEMNTRLQVEHAVTECVTGLDLVRLQLGVAAGRPLGLTQEEVRPRGHALECRLYAEDPDRDDLPSPGRILAWSMPEGPGIRVDAGVDAGSDVPVHYDPLLAKVVTWGADRAESVERMADALRRTVALGVTTNLSRLRAILAHPAFLAAKLSTWFIDDHLSSPSAPTAPPLEALAAAAASLQADTRPAAAGRPQAADPWARLGAFRLGASPRRA
jgi:3-methylcrotonyl-CoA carboxylase alpha subunit